MTETYMVDIMTDNGGANGIHIYRVPNVVAEPMKYLLQHTQTIIAVIEKAKWLDETHVTVVGQKWLANHRQWAQEIVDCWEALDSYANRVAQAKDMLYLIEIIRPWVKDVE